MNKTIKSMWHFWNHCFLGRTQSYQPRKLKTIQSNSPQRKETCTICGIEISLYRYHNKKLVCNTCKEKAQTNFLSYERELNIKRATDSAEKFNDLLDGCEKLGTCDILASHHELLKGDDNRIKTSFMLDLVCKDDFEDKWVEIKAKQEEVLQSAKKRYRPIQNPIEAV